MDRSVDHSAVFACFKGNRYLLWFKYSLAHINSSAVDLAIMSCKAYFHYARKSFNCHIVLVNNTVVTHKLGNASDTVTAHFSFRAVKVEHSHLCVCYFGRADKYNSVAADTEMSVRKIDSKTLRVVDLLVKAVEVYIIVSAALHLGELKVLLFFSHVVDVNYLCGVLGKLAAK